MAVAVLVTEAMTEGGAVLAVLKAAAMKDAGSLVDVEEMAMEVEVLGRAGGTAVWALAETVKAAEAMAAAADKESSR